MPQISPCAGAAGANLAPPEGTQGPRGSSRGRCPQNGIQPRGVRLGRRQPSPRTPALGPRHSPEPGPAAGGAGAGTGAPAGPGGGTEPPAQGLGTALSPAGRGATEGWGNGGGGEMSPPAPGGSWGAGELGEEGGGTPGPWAGHFQQRPALGLSNFPRCHKTNRCLCGARVGAHTGGGVGWEGVHTHVCAVCAHICTVMPGVCACTHRVPAPTHAHGC